ncbi:hypothetical protein L0Z72_11740 [candidate division KSB1 bacterium]|nr:hypothetical protein [candidate division KSB1 bacterium]
MNLKIQYLTDDRGTKTAVQIPYDEWLEFYARYRHLRQYAKLKKALTDAFKEKENNESRSTKKISLEEFLNEC